MGSDLLISRFVHRCLSWTVMSASKTCHVYFKKDGTNRWLEVEKALRFDSKPVRHVPGIGQSSGKSNHVNLKKFLI